MFPKRKLSKFEGVRIEKLMPERYNFFRKVVADATIPSLLPEVLTDDTLNERLTYMAFNNLGFCGTVARSFNPVAYWTPNLENDRECKDVIIGATVVKGTEILGAYASPRNPEPNIVGALAECLLDDISKSYTRVGRDYNQIFAVILGQAPGNRPQNTRDYTKSHMHKYDINVLGEIHPSAKKAEIWAEKHMKLIGYDPIHWGPVYMIEAKDVRTSYHFFEPIPRFTGIAEWEK